MTQSTDHAVNVSRSVMLLELDRFTGVAMFAINLASNCDTAFTRPILGHIEMPLPDAAARRRLCRGYLPAKLPLRLNDSDWDRLITGSEGLAGGEILNAVLYAAAMAVERDGPSCTITAEDLLDAVEVGLRAKEAIG